MIRTLEPFTVEGKGLGKEVVKKLQLRIKRNMNRFFLPQRKNHIQKREILK